VKHRLPGWCLWVVLAALGASCKRADSLIQLSVTSDVSYQDERLGLSVDEGPWKYYADVSVGPTEAFQAGIYLPGSVAGTVDVMATLDDGACVLATGPATVFNVASGQVADPVELVLISTTGGCNPLPPADGGAGGAMGSGGTSPMGSGGSEGTGGVTGSTGGAQATGGAVGTGGLGAGGGAVGTAGKGGGGMSGTGGVVGTGGAGACGNLVDDMESQSGFICMGNGRSGHWFTYIDGVNGSNISPLPSDTSPALPALLSPARGSSRYGMHATGTYASYAGIGCLLNNPVIGETPKTYDAAAAGFVGVHFFVKSTAGLSFVVQTSATISTTYGGTCTAASCYGASATLPSSTLSSWQEVNIPFSALSPGVAPFRTDDLWNLAFQPAVPGPFDFWIDDVSFY
jgi:hypothetical protein